MLAKYDPQIRDLWKALFVRRCSVLVVKSFCHPLLVKSDQPPVWRHVPQLPATIRSDTLALLLGSSPWLSEAKVNQLDLAGAGVQHDIIQLHVAMYQSLGVHVLEGSDCSVSGTYTTPQGRAIIRSPLLLFQYCLFNRTAGRLHDQN